MLSIPIIGIGGITCVEDVVEFMLAGASMVQIGTSNYKMPNLAATLYSDLEKYCKDNNLNSYSELIGRVCYI